MAGYIVLVVVIMLFVLILSLVTINKGYDFKHSIDELPEEDNDANEDDDRTKDNHG